MKKDFRKLKAFEPPQGTGLIADPIYHYMMMTDRIEGEHTERNVIDTPWVQRLRRIFQLQSARWVFPTAEHTRFQHSLGTMHVAGTFPSSFIPLSLRSSRQNCPPFPISTNSFAWPDSFMIPAMAPFAISLMSII
ncbi:MAG: hypothetical protein ACXU93_00125 [Thermodesulfobacteriota bacterium]